MEALSKNMDLHSSTYDNLNFLVDYNAGMKHVAWKDFYSLHPLASLINKRTC